MCPQPHAAYLDFYGASADVPLLGPRLPGNGNFVPYSPGLLWPQGGEWGERKTRVFDVGVIQRGNHVRGAGVCIRACDSSLKIKANRRAK